MDERMVKGGRRGQIEGIKRMRNRRNERRRRVKVIRACVFTIGIKTT